MIMNKIPSFIIVADRGHAIAYEKQDSGSLRKFDAIEIEEGANKLSELVTDKAGRFGNTGTPNKDGSSAERLPLEAEMEMRCFRKVAQQIETWVGSRNGESWGFAAPSEINGAILDGVDKKCLAKLSINLKRDLTTTPVTKLVEHFAKQAEFPVPV